MATTRVRPGLAEIEAARARLDGVARVTPVFGSETLSQLAGGRVLLKAENLQRTGSFKIRGAYNRMSTLSPEERAAGVVAASAGNHGQAVAWAAREVGANARIFMPQDAPMAKVEATRHYGADIEFDRDRARGLSRRGDGVRRRDRRDVRASVRGSARDRRPGDDRARARGAGAPTSRPSLIPVGGGGLASGIALALRAVKPGLRIVGVQAEGTLPGGSGFTIADGIAVKKPGELTMSILDDVLDDMVSVSDEQITEAIVLLLERTKLVVEGGGAVGIAALLAGKLESPGVVVPGALRRQHRRDAPDLGDASRARGRGPLPRRAHARSRPPR